MIDIAPEHLAIVREILDRRLPDAEVWAFGSRAHGTPKKHSDLDLAIIVEQPVDNRLMAELAEDFSESDLPIRVDIVDWASATERFREIIARGHVVLRTRGT